MKVAVIGCGRMGLRHIQAIKNLDLSLVGLYDPRLAAMQQAVQQYHLSETICFNTVSDLLIGTKPSCVIIASTAPSHASYVEMCAASGVTHILCEKPMATSIDACEAMIAVCEKHAVHLAINHQMRFMEQYTRVKAWLDQSALGGLSSVTINAGNFGLAMNGTHYIEMFRYMTDEYPSVVWGEFSKEIVPNPRGAEFEDRAGIMRLKTPSGKRFFLDASTDQGHGITVTYNARYGQITVDELAGQLWINYRAESADRALPTTRYGQPAHRQMEKIAPADVIASTQAVLQALITQTNYPTAYDGLSAVKTLVAAYISDEQNGEVAYLNKVFLPTMREFPWA